MTCVMLGLGATGLDDGPTCSAAGCVEPARWTLQWRNPRIHDAARVKEWAACDAHRDHLHGWLASRDFPVEVSAFGAGGASAPSKDGD